VTKNEKGKIMGNTIEKLTKELAAYAKAYREPPYGREVEGTPELLERAALSLTEAADSIAKLKKKYMDGINVHYQGDDANDGIECPVCGFEVEMMIMMT